LTLADVGNWRIHYSIRKRERLHRPKYVHSPAGEKTLVFVKVDFSSERYAARYLAGFKLHRIPI
jgi:hypothetical protein